MKYRIYAATIPSSLNSSMTVGAAEATADKLDHRLDDGYK